MALAAVIPTNGSGFDTTGTSGGTVFTTGSITFTSGRSYVLGVLATGTSSASPSSVVGSSTGTWGATTPTSASFNPVSGTTSRINCYTINCSSTVTETLTITYGSARTTCLWIMTEWTGQDTSGFLVQGDTANSNSVTSVQGMTNNAMGLASFADATNNGLLMFVGIANNATMTAAGSLTKLDQVADTAPNTTLGAFWQVGEDATPDATFTSSHAGAIAFELKAAAAAAATGVPLMTSASTGLRLYRRRLVAGGYA